MSSLGIQPTMRYEQLLQDSFKKSIIDKGDTYMWKTHFSDWESLLRIIICPDIIRVMVPELSSVISSMEDQIISFSWDIKEMR